MDLIKQQSPIHGVKTYKYGLTSNDFLGRESIEDLYHQKKISSLDYYSTIHSINTLLLFECYQECFPDFKDEEELPTNYTPRGYIRQGKKLINLTQRRHESIKAARKRVKCPYVIVRDPAGRVQRQRKK